jgi:hypothetical protein
MFNKLLKQYGTTVNIDYATTNSMGQIISEGSYSNVKVFIDPVGEGLNYENQKFANIKTAKAVFYLPISYKVIINSDTNASMYVPIELNNKKNIKFSLPNSSFSWSITAVTPIVTVGNEALYQVGVQQ